MSGTPGYDATRNKSSARSAPPRGPREQCSPGSNALGVKGRSGTMAIQITLLDLVTAVSESAASEGEVIATVVHLVNSGIVQLCGNFRGARFDLDEVGVSAAA